MLGLLIVREKASIYTREKFIAVDRIFGISFLFRQNGSVISFIAHQQVTIRVKIKNIDYIFSRML